jgi:hypothetical protein
MSDFNLALLVTVGVAALIALGIGVSRATWLTGPRFAVLVIVGGVIAIALMALGVHP